MRTQNITVSGMSGASCTGSVTTALQALAGVRAVIVSLETGDATVQFDERMTTTGELDAAVRAAGYGVEPTRELTDRKLRTATPPGRAR